MRRVLLLGGVAAMLAGCGQAADITGAVAGGGASLASANPAVGYAVGIGVRAAVSAGMKGVMRDRQQAEQDAVAAVIGGLAPGESRSWEIRHDIPIGNQRGEVRLVRVIDSALAECREALFSVADGRGPAAKRQWFLTTACRQGASWKWAAAEPATARWGSLH